MEQEIKKRTRKNKEFWFIDISPLKTLTKVKSLLGNLPLDIDDDIYVYIFRNNSLADIWEIYKWGSDENIILTQFGTWKKNSGLSRTTLNKWQRRGNLTVSMIEYDPPVQIYVPNNTNLDQSQLICSHR